MFINRNRMRPKPSNRGVTTTARSGIDVLARAAQERYVNALAVEGYPVQYFAYKRLGTTCTCSSHSTTAEAPALNTPGITVLDSEGNASPAHIQAMLQGSAVYIQRYGSRNQGQGFPDDYLEERTVPNRPLIQSQAQYNKTTDASDEFGENLEPGDDLASLLDDEGSLAGTSFLQTAGASGCGVCLGTGIVGGYTFVNGSRICYDTQAPWVVSGFSLDAAAAPHVYRAVGAPAWAQTFVMFPKGATGLRVFRLWNSKTIAGGYTMEVHDGTQWVPMTARSVMSLADGRLHAVRVIAGPAGLAFTHLEVSFDLDLNPVYVEWARMTETENPRLPENMESLSVVVSPTVPRVRMYDVLIESTYDRVWKITSVTNFQDRQLRPHGWEVQIRLVQELEYPQLLANAVLLHRHPEFTNALVPAVDNENWSGHEDVPTR